jgi:hypothetical protein
MSVSIDGPRSRYFSENQPSVAPEPARTERTAPSTESSPSRFERVLHGLGATIEAGERTVAGAASGYASLDAAELIALQAGIYRYSEAIDLTAKLVDRATNAVRTVLQGGH